jgi:hypothetical protein
MWDLEIVTWLVIFAAHDYNESPSSLAEHNFCEAIDQLALAFSSRWVDIEVIKHCKLF